jgi:hypothetical protein
MIVLEVDKENEENLCSSSVSGEAVSSYAAAPRPPPPQRVLLSDNEEIRSNGKGGKKKKVRFCNKVTVFPHRRVLTEEKLDYWWTVAELQRSMTATVEQHWDDSLDKEQESLRGLEWTYDEGLLAVNRLHVQTVLDDVKRQKL